MEGNRLTYIWAALRIALGWLFLWAFLDKLFGLGYATRPDGAWLAGGSPAAGFYQSMAGNPVVDWLFMLGLLGLAVALILGIGVQIAGYAGTLLVLLMWSSHLPPANNPLIDQHIVYAIVLIGLAMVRAGRWVGLGTWWARTVAKNYSWLQ